MHAKNKIISTNEILSNRLFNMFFLSLDDAVQKTQSVFLMMPETILNASIRIAIKEHLYRDIENTK